MDIQKTNGAADGSSGALEQALVHAGGTRLLGFVPPGTRPGEVVTMEACCEIRAGLATIPTPQGIATAPQAVVCLLDGAPTFVNVAVFVTLIRYFSDMDKEESEKYVLARRNKLEEIQRMRAERAGITLARDLPKGGLGGGFNPST